MTGIDFHEFNIYKLFFNEKSPKQINHRLLHVICLLVPLFIGKKYLHEVKLCCNVLLETQARRLLLKNINPSKMLTSVKLM